ncbi:hypothetical protein [Jezberella montanilacus]|nr:hypothetical protein [Jezberella montanilacus]
MATTDRNIFPYCFLSMVVNPATKIFYSEKLTFDQKTFHVRLVFLLITVVGFLSILILLVQSTKDVTISRFTVLNLLVLYAFTTPLLVGGSIQANLEGSIGVALFGLSSLIAYLGVYELRKNVSVYIFIAGFLISLGKNEWPLIALFTSFFYILVLQFLYRDAACSLVRKRQFSTALTYVFGLLAGILFCYLLSPKDYVDGYLLMRNMNGSHLPILGLVRATWSFLYPVAALVGFALFLYIIRFKKNFEYGPIIFIWLGSGIGMFTGFLNSGWIGDGFPRYFIPSVISLLPFLLIVLRETKRNKDVFLAAILLIGLMINGLSLAQSYLHRESITSVPGLSTIKLRSDTISLVGQNSADRNLIPFDHFAIRYYFPDADMVSNGMGLAGAKFILDKFGNQTMRIIVAPE